MFYFIKSETSDLFVNHFDGHFVYLKTLDFYFNVYSEKGENFRRFVNREVGLSFPVSDKPYGSCGLKAPLKVPRKKKC